MRSNLTAAAKFVALALTAVAVAGSARGNLLLNPSVEDPSPAYWWSGVFGTSGGAWWWNNDPDKAHSGVCLLATGFWGSPNTSYWGQTIFGVSPGKQYDFGVWTKTESGFNGSYYLMVEFQDASGQTLLTNRSSVWTGANTTYTWRSMITDPAPAGTAQIAFSLRAEGGANSVLWDDASVEEYVIPEPSTALLTAVGLGLLVGVRRRASA